MAARPGRAQSGGLIPHGARAREQIRHVAADIDRVLTGARPGDPPIAQPTTSAMLISLQTAKALGLTIPALVLTRADALIE